MAQIANGESGLSVRNKINASIGKTDLITVTGPVDLDNPPAGASVTIHEFTDEGAAEAFAASATPLQITVLK